ncbi:MAG: hypothetical protein ABH804_02135 [archaeon]
MEKSLQYLQDAEKIIRTLDHLIYVTFPIVKDKRLLLKITIEMKTAVASCINAILQYEYLYKRIKLYQEPRENLRTFMEKCAPRYKITEEDTNLIKELFQLAEAHKQSPMEFVREEKIVIMSNSFHPHFLTIEKTKKFITMAKGVLSKAKKMFGS